MPNKIINHVIPVKIPSNSQKKIWGGERLAYKSKEHDESIGESWEISAVEDNISVVSNGILADNDLQELIEVYMGTLSGIIYTRNSVSNSLY